MSLLRDLVTYTWEGLLDGARDGLRGALRLHTPILYLSAVDLVAIANERKRGRVATKAWGWWRDAPGMRESFNCWCSVMPEIEDDQVDDSKLARISRLGKVIDGGEVALTFDLDRTDSHPDADLTIAFD